MTRSRISSNIPCLAVGASAGTRFAAGLGDLSLTVAVRRRWPACRRLEDLGQEIRLRLIANQDEIARAVGIVEHDRAELFTLQEEQFDLAQGDALGQCVVEPLRAELLAVDADDGHSGRKAGPVAHHSGDDVDDPPIGAEAQPERIAGRDATALARDWRTGRGLGRILEAIAAPADNVQRQRRPAAARPAGRETISQSKSASSRRSLTISGSS